MHLLFSSFEKKFIFKIVMLAMDFEQLIFQIQYSLCSTRLVLIKPCLKFLNKLQSFILLCSCSIWKRGLFLFSKNAVVHFWSRFISLFCRWNSQHTQEFFPIISKAILLFGMLSELSASQTTTSPKMGSPPIFLHMGISFSEGPWLLFLLSTLLLTISALAVRCCHSFYWVSRYGHDILKSNSSITSVSSIGKWQSLCKRVLTEKWRKLSWMKM